MKIHYYPETDSLYIDLKDRSSVDSREIADGLVIDFGEDGSIVGIDIDHASQTLDLTTLETVSLPIAATSITLDVKPGIPSDAVIIGTDGAVQEAS